MDSNYMDIKSHQPKVELYQSLIKKTMESNLENIAAGFCILDIELSDNATLINQCHLLVI